MRNIVDLIGRTGNLSSFLELVMQGGTVKRFHNVETIKDNPTASHQWGVALLCYVMCKHLPIDRQLALIMAALTHDLAEKAFGDIPAPAKRLMGIRETLNSYEADFLKDNELFFELFDEEKMILKAADIFDGMLFCVHERALGNKFLSRTYDIYRSYATEEIEMQVPQTEMLIRIDAMCRQANGC
jgi:5'-deoxynucleotidase YfbR-like HD superfamily hydrolase